MKQNSVVCGKVLVVGDIHLSDTFTGRHKNYLETCLNTLDAISNQVYSTGVGCIIFAGDIAGFNDSNVRDREVFSIFCRFFKKFKDSGVRVVIVRGNHDFGDYPDFQFLADLNFIETAQSLGGFIDYFGESSQEIPEIRFHLVDYGTENRKLDILEGGTTNIVVAHNNFTIQGVTNWYQKKGGIELANLSNFAGVYMVLSGHIHAPSPELNFVDAVWGNPIGLFYLGCPTRPALESYTSVWFMEFSFNNGSTDFNAVPYQLKSVEDEYYLEEDFVEDLTTTDLDEVQRRENLQEILGSIMSCRISSGDIDSQILKIPNASDSAKSIAVKYLNMARNEL